ncbi:MAG: hypothetical protein JKY09_09050, partial [Crocinitomicaceae bacterium]|nr:hypothetical protein [Crocinitomicaceae bacterium]
MKRTTTNPILFSFLCALILSACGNDIEEKNQIDEDIFDPNSSLHAIFDDKLFSIPSPVQTGYLLKQLNLSFDESLLHDDASVSEYVTEYRQALNLGIYGTDLGYAALYSQKNISMRYLNAVEKLTAQLGLDAAFDTSFISQFEKHNDDEDAMIILMSEAFKKADYFLKNADRKSTSALILTGGWIESLYFACELNSKKSSKEIKRRIGEQKESLLSIIDLLSEYNKDGNNDELINRLGVLKTSFDKITMNYEYAA